MRLLKLCLLVSLMSGYAWPQEQTKPPETPPPLTSEEKQDVLAQLLLIPVLRTQVLDYQKFIAEQEKIREQDKLLWAQSLNTEQENTRIAEKKTAVTERERDLALDQVKFYQNALNTCMANKKRSAWCWIKKFFTAWTARCT